MPVDKSLPLFVVLYQKNNFNVILSLQPGIQVSHPAKSI